MQTISKAENPAFFSMLRKDYGYRKHRVTIYPCESVTIREPYWSGGSIEAHFTITTGTRAGQFEPRREHLSVPSNGFPQFGGERTVDVLHGRAVVTGGTFQGKPRSWSIYMHPNDVADWDIG
jgi:hypothetical protein